ncbi:MAG: hypothetical protein QM767_21980 [Anaeromyxobacter sp.]
MNELPAAIRDLVRLLAGMPGVEAVALGGALALQDRSSAWPTRACGPSAATPPARWARPRRRRSRPLTRGSANAALWHLNVVERWRAEAEAGRFEVDLLLGYLAGLPTYSLAAELAVAARRSPTARRGRRRARPGAYR